MAFTAFRGGGGFGGFSANPSVPYPRMAASAAGAKPVYRGPVRRQDAIDPELGAGNYHGGPIIPFATPTPVPNAGAFRTPAFLPTNPGPPDPGGLGDINNDIPPADTGYDPRFPNYDDNGHPVVDVHSRGSGPVSPFGAGITPGVYAGLFPGDVNDRGAFFEGYWNGQPVFAPQSVSGGYGPQIANPSGIRGGLAWAAANSGGDMANWLRSVLMKHY